MIIDSSAILAVLLAEPESGACAEKIADSVIGRVSAATYVEAAIVADSRLGARRSRALDQLIETAPMVIEPIDAAQARIAREAHRRFGKGRHRAGLNLGDCFAYALAKSLDEPLLFVGDDFSRTDVARA